MKRVPRLGINEQTKVNGAACVCSSTGWFGNYGGANTEGHGPGKTGYCGCRCVSKNYDPYNSGANQSWAVSVGKS